MELIIILLAPILQIILSVLRIKGVIKLPIGVISFLAGFASIFLSVWAGKVMLDELDTEFQGRAHCGMPALGCFIGGVMIDAVLNIIITLISYAVYRGLKRQITAV
jgi:hypothetical protein